MRQELYYILEKPHLSKYGLLVQKIIFLNILLNLFSLIGSQFFSFGSEINGIFETINLITVIGFIVELVLRYIAIGINPQYAGFLGRVKFTFTFYTIVDILSILPFILTFMSLNTSYLRTIRLIRFVRILKLIRMQKVFKNLFSINYFATSGLMLQSFLLFIISSLIIYLFSYGYGSISESASIFLDPPQIAELTDRYEIIIGVFELILGLVIGGALISIITSAFIKIIDSIKNGYSPYKGTGHIIIVNANAKLEFILSEIDKYFLYIGQEQDVVILLPPSDVEKFKNNLKKYKSLEVFVIAGDLLNWNSYERVNINKASKVVSLLDNPLENKNQNRKFLQFLLSNKYFTNKDLEFVIETDSVVHAKEIYSYIFDGTSHHYTIIDNDYLVGKILNRSVVNYDYFQILSELLTFNGYEFYVLEYNTLFKQQTTFEEASLQITDAILVGIVRDGKVLLNPKSQGMLLPSDKLIIIMKNVFAYTIQKLPKLSSLHVDIDKPTLKEDRNILIVGDYTDIKPEDITHFITQESVDALQYYVQPDSNYMHTKIWDKIRDDNFDVIILNIEDEDEYALTLYLRAVYQNDPLFLSKIVNIIHNPTHAMLLNDNKQKNSLILSQKIIGEFMAQSLFNRYIPEIFDEITASRGNEFYILEYNKYKHLFKLDYHSLKSVLLQNDMIYIGGFKDEKFIFDIKDIQNLDKIVVLSEGIE